MGSNPIVDKLKQVRDTFLHFFSIADALVKTSMPTMRIGDPFCVHKRSLPGICSVFFDVRPLTDDVWVSNFCSDQWESRNDVVNITSYIVDIDHPRHWLWMCCYLIVCKCAEGCLLLGLEILLFLLSSVNLLKVVGTSAKYNRLQFQFSTNIKTKAQLSAVDDEIQVVLRCLVSSLPDVFCSKVAWL